MTSAQSNGEILKTDTLARVRTPSQRKQGKRPAERLYLKIS
jgi:hypothetical protein